MADGYTEADLRLVEEALPRVSSDGRVVAGVARDVLAALVGAGRLLPEDPQPHPASVAGAIANLMRATDPASPEYEGIRRAYGVALDAAGLASALPEDTRTEYGVRWHDTSVVVDGYVRETAVAVGAQYEHAEAVQRRVGPWVPVPGPVVGAGMDLAGTPTAGAQTYATDTQTGPAGVPEEKTR